jgi:uncharacterized protein YjbI with pentapeptide repeats
MYYTITAPAVARPEGNFPAPLDLAPGPILQCLGALDPAPQRSVPAPIVLPEVHPVTRPLRRLLLPLTLLLTISTALTWAAPTREAVIAALTSAAAAGQDFSGAPAAGLDAFRVDLSRSLWVGADLRGANFYASSLVGADLRRASLRGAIIDRTSLADADLSGADLCGAVIRRAVLSGTRLDGCRLEGATFQQILLSGNGGTHATALRLALQQATQTTLSRPWVAGLSGDAFGFVYNTSDPAFWPGTPFSLNPLLAAAKIMGVDATLRQAYHSERALREEAAAGKAAYLLPLANDSFGGALGKRPLWGMLGKRSETGHRISWTVTLPPLGEQTMRADDLVKAWEGPWETLQPAGAVNVKAGQPLVTFGASRAAVDTPQQAQAALRQGAELLLDKRTYGPLVPGEAGLLKLAADLREVAGMGDMDGARKLARWEDFPRQCLLGARAEACEFLREAAETLPPAQKQAALDAAAVYQPPLAMLADQWPGLAIGSQTTTGELRERYNRAADIIAALAAADHSAATLMMTAGR